MDENILGRLFEHNHWANMQIVQACSALTDAQLDAEPRSATRGTIRRTLTHLVDSQHNYLARLTGQPSRPDRSADPAPAELAEDARSSGEALIALARDPSRLTRRRLQTDDGYLVDPWVLMVQIINHATEHREQINSMLTALGVTPPDLDGWTYGEVTGALTPLTTAS